jgi:hypothetical protein
VFHKKLSADYTDFADREMKERRSETIRQNDLISSEVISLLTA